MPVHTAVDGFGYPGETEPGRPSPPRTAQNLLHQQRIPTPRKRAETYPISRQTHPDIQSRGARAAYLGNSTPDLPEKSQEAHCFQGNFPD